MRPAGEVRQALFKAAGELATPERGGTLKELAAKACVSYDAAMYTVGNMVRTGHLAIARRRKVQYRNRPVAEYKPVTPEAIDAAAGFVDLGELLKLWNR